eukprot:6203800-Pleurochrysis_carterae.AAC.2
MPLYAVTVKAASSTRRVTKLDKGLLTSSARSRVSGIARISRWKAAAGNAVRREVVADSESCNENSNSARCWSAQSPGPWHPDSPGSMQLHAGQVRGVALRQGRVAGTGTAMPRSCGVGRRR